MTAQAVSGRVCKVDQSIGGLEIYRTMKGSSFFNAYGQEISGIVDGILGIVGNLPGTVKDILARCIIEFQELLGVQYR